MNTYKFATAHARGGGDNVFLHGGDGDGPDGTYTWAEIVETARDWGDVISDTEPTLTFRAEDDEGTVEVTVDAHQADQ